jgi:hypothetical protein
MLDTLKTLTLHQYEAALCTLNACIDRCPESSWHARVANYLFSQLAFHTLIFTDLYLGGGEESIGRQPFHVANAQVFADYEEFADRPPRNRYERAWVKQYLEHCRRKAAEVIASETAETLAGPSGFDWRKFTRAELHVYNIRHIQHHAAQLSLRLRLDHGLDIPWVGSGWRELPMPSA